jgi:hypothetical protein
MHTYPFHDTYYNPTFWGVPEAEEKLNKQQQADAAVQRAMDYATKQYQSTADYIKSLGVKKPLHIGETGWASVASSSYGATGSMAADEYKEKLFYDMMRKWTNDNKITCFYFEAFDEKWKDEGNVNGSENHFGLINLNGQAKYALWKMVDNGSFKGLTRNGVPITKSFGGDEQKLMETFLAVPLVSAMGLKEITSVNTNRTTGQQVTEDIYVITNSSLVPGKGKSITYPSAKIKINAWEGTCGIVMTTKGVIDVTTGTGDTWWGCALELQAGNTGEDLSAFKNGYLNMDISGDTKSSFKIGYQTGVFSNGTQVNNFLVFAPGTKYSLQKDWTTYKIPVTLLKPGKTMDDVTGIVYLAGNAKFDGGHVYLQNVYYSKQ